ncbi:MAG: mandelate racemase/muconate lactonizing enzyme family protein [Pirellulales bacterium]|nr:mandelate racemase/muconate lactonizing enzyme family protein [Pirellulales bacterium]
MKITELRPFILHVPVTGSGIADSSHQVTDWGAVGALIDTDAGIRGCGYTGTHGHLPTDRLICDCIEHAYAPLLAGEDPRNVRALWSKLYHCPSIRWVGRAGITQMALAAIDVALWDIQAKAAGMPLWKLLGGGESKRLEAYNTDGGWLNWSLEQLVADAQTMVEEGFRGIKIKVGSPDPNDDLRRIAAVREAIGPGVKLMVDGNGRWDLPTARNLGRKFCDFDIVWFEEPMWFDDVRGHRALARAIETPIALGEQLYSLDAFASFIEAGAVQYVQPDVTRLGGITPWLQVADLALAYRLPVVAHVADMMQIHQHLAFAHPASHLMEYIPWMRECFEEPATVRGSYFHLPQSPGAGTTLRPDALERFGVDR